MKQLEGHENSFGSPLQSAEVGKIPALCLHIDVCRTQRNGHSLVQLQPLPSTFQPKTYRDIDRSHRMDDWLLAAAGAACRCAIGVTVSEANAQLCEETKEV